MKENYRLLKPFLRGFPLIILAMIIAVLAAQKYLSYVTPMYESTAKLKLADVSEGVPSSNLFKDFDVFTSSNKIAAEIEVLKSSVLLTKTFNTIDFGTEIYRVGKIKKIELYHDSPITINSTLSHSKAYDVRYPLQVTSDSTFLLSLPQTEQTVEGQFGEPVVFPYGQILIDLNEELIKRKARVDLVDLYEFEFLSSGKLLSGTNANLDVVSVDKDVAVIRINYKSAVPEKASLFVNKLAEMYIHDYIETKYRAAETTVNFLENQIEDVSEQLSSTESSIENYRDNKNIINIQQETETDLRKISQLKIQQTNVKMNLTAIRELDQYMQTRKDSFLLLAPNFEAFNDLLSTEIVKNIKALQAEKKDLLLIYTPEEERVQVIDRKIEDLKNYLLESISNTKRNLEIKYSNLTQDIREAEKIFIGIPAKEKNLTILNREFQIFQQSYNFLNEKKIEAEIAQAAKIAFHRILAPGRRAKEPVSPNATIIVIVSAVMGMFGMIALIYIVHLVKAKVNDAFTIEKNSSIPIAVLTPKLKSLQEIERYFLKEAIQLELKEVIKENSLIVMSSSTNHEGRSFHVKHLAKALAMQERSVLLADVEGDLGSWFEEGPETEHEEWRKRITYLPMNHPRYDRYSKKALLEEFESHRKRQDVIIINNEALEQETKGLLFMGVADTNLVVLDSRRTPASQVTETEILKDEFVLENTWFVLNREKFNPNLIIEVATWIRQCVTIKNPIWARA